MKTMNWGIIGCGDVTEKKSGPAFQKVPGSKLVSVMRRNAERAEDYARRHGVGHWTTNANDILTSPDIDAVYIATHPNTHAEYTLRAAKAGKAVYVEKPMAASPDHCGGGGLTVCVDISATAYRVPSRQRRPVH